MRALLALAAASAVLLPVAPADARQGPAELRLVATVPYLDGTHIETATIGGRDWVFAATQDLDGPGTLRVIDVTRPTRPVVVRTLECGRFQGHLQVSADRRTLVLGVDGPARGDGTCVRARGEGFVTLDITDPRRTRPIGFAAIPGGSHSTATHPRLPIVYNAPDGSPVPDRGASPVLEAWSIADPARPRLVGSVALPGTHSPHDLSFNRTGTLAAVASITAFHLIDTRDPLRPKVLYTGQCPGCQHTHEARFTPDGRTLVINDEAVVGPYPCPGGALYFYDLGEGAPTLVGSYAIGSAGALPTGGTGFCTPHVFDISDDGRTVAASWHEAGVRLLDIEGHRGVTVGTTSSGPDAPREVAAYLQAGADHFTAKMHRGPYVYAVDMDSGLQVLEIRRQPDKR